MAWLEDWSKNIAKKNLGEAKQASKQARLEAGALKLLVTFPGKRSKGCSGN